MSYGRVQSYLVTYEDGETSRQRFTAAQASEVGAVVETDGMDLQAAITLVRRWNTNAQREGAKLRYAIPFVKTALTMPVAGEGGAC